MNNQPDPTLHLSQKYLLLQARQIPETKLRDSISDSRFPFIVAFYTYEIFPSKVYLYIFHRTLNTPSFPHYYRYYDFKEKYK